LGLFEVYVAATNDDNSFIIFYIFAFDITENTSILIHNLEYAILIVSTIKCSKKKCNSKHCLSSPLLSQTKLLTDCNLYMVSQQHCESEDQPGGCLPLALMDQPVTIYSLSGSEEGPSMNTTSSTISQPTTLRK
jgi:hypothetical protein